MYQILIEKDEKFTTKSQGRHLIVMPAKAEGIICSQDASGKPAVGFTHPLLAYNPRALAMKRGDFTPEEIESFSKSDIIPTNTHDDIEVLSPNQDMVVFIDEPKPQLQPVVSLRVVDEVAKDEAKLKRRQRNKGVDQNLSNQNEA